MIRRIRARFQSSAQRIADWMDEFADFLECLDFELQDIERRQAKERHPAGKKHGGRQGPSDEQLRQALAVYNAADRAPTRTVSEQFGIAHRTASLWVARAKDKGLT